MSDRDVNGITPEASEYDLRARACLNCGNARLYLTDGWCEECAPDPEAALLKASEIHRRAMETSLETSQRILARKVQRGDPEREIQQVRKHIEYLQGELGIKSVDAA